MEEEEENERKFLDMKRLIPAHNCI